MAFAEWAETQTGLGFLGVHADASDEAGRKFVEEHGWEFPVLSDSKGVQLRRWEITGHPATVLVDGFGRIAHKLYGPADAATWDAMAAKLG